MRRALVAGRTLAIFAILTLAASVWSPPVHAQVLQCPADAPSGDAVANKLFTDLRPTLNYAWTQAAAAIDPLYPNDPSNPPGGPMFGTGTQHVSCTDDAYALCALDEFYPVCDHISAFLNGYDLEGMSQFSLTFKDVASTSQNPKSLATHSNRGPDAGLVTDGVFAADGTSWDDPTYTVILPLVGPTYGLTVDLGAVITNICGSASTCKGPIFQGDKNAYLFEYSSDGAQWQCYGQFASGSDSGLRTRGASSLPAKQGCPASLVETFSARYLRVSAYSGDGNYSVSELQVRDVGGNLLTLYQPAIGPLPAQIVDGTPVSDGTAWNDKHAVVLPSTGSAHALVVDLGDVTDLCGNASNCASGPIVQADRNVFQLDYSTDGYNWLPVGQFPAIDSDGLHTRGLSGTPPASFSGRYARIWAVSGNGDYSVAQLSLYDTKGATPAAALISVGSPTYGPEPFVTNGEFAPDGGTDWNDPRYATVLRLCSTPNSVCPTATALTAPLIVDLGTAFPVTQLTLQADRHSFQVDISSDRGSWNPLYTFPIVSSGSGLLTRDSPVLSPTTGRYLRVYGVEGDDSNYSVSELQVFTPVANTPCSYQLPDPNAAQGFSCSYDGQFTYDLSPNAPAALSFKVYSGQVNVICTNGLTTDTQRVATASKNAVCKATVSGPTSGSGALTYPAGSFCAGTCAGAAATDVLTYAQFGTDPLPQFTATGVSCPIDSDFDKLIVGLFEGVAAQAMNTALNKVLGPRSGTPSGLMPYPASCETSPAEASTVKGHASEVGSGTDRGRVEIRGRFTAQNALALDQTTFMLTDLLDELGGAGELVKGGAGSALLPLTLQPRTSNKRDAAIFDTPHGLRPSVRMEVTTQNRNRNVYDFALTVDGVTIPVGPASCAGRPHPVARLKTAFILAGSAGQDALVSATMDWTCLGTELRVHSKTSDSP